MDIKRFLASHSVSEGEFASNGYRQAIEEGNFPSLTANPYQYHRNGWVWKDIEGKTVHIVRVAGSTGERKDFEVFIDREARYGTVNYDRAHSVGDMFGVESPYGIGLLPSKINRSDQAHVIEKHFKELAEDYRQQSADLYLVTETSNFNEKGGFFVNSVHYQAIAVSPDADRQQTLYSVSLQVDDGSVVRDGDLATTSISIRGPDGEKIHSGNHAWHGLGNDLNDHALYGYQYDDQIDDSNRLFEQETQAMVDKWDRSIKDDFNRKAEGKERQSNDRGGKGSEQVGKSQSSLKDGPPPPRGPGMSIAREQHRAAMAKDHERAVADQSPTKNHGNTFSQDKKREKGDLKKEFDRSR